MEIVVLVLGIVGCVMSPLIVGALPAALAVLLGLLRLMLKKKKPLKKLGKAEIMIGIIFGVIAIIISLYVYYAGVMEIDFVKIVRQYIQNIRDFFANLF